MTRLDGHNDMQLYIVDAHNAADAHITHTLYLLQCVMLNVLWQTKYNTVYYLNIYVYFQTKHCRLLM